MNNFTLMCSISEAHVNASLKERKWAGLEIENLDVHFESLEIDMFHPDKRFNIQPGLNCGLLVGPEHVYFAICIVGPFFSITSILYFCGMQSPTGLVAK